MHVVNVSLGSLTLERVHARMRSSEVLKLHSFTNYTLKHTNLKFHNKVDPVVLFSTPEMVSPVTSGQALFCIVIKADYAVSSDYVILSMLCFAYSNSLWALLFTDVVASCRSDR